MKIIFQKSIIKDVKGIKNKKLKKVITKIIEDLEEAEALKSFKGLKKLSGHPTAYRIRIGDYRLGIYYEENTVYLARFLKRSDIYKVFPK